MPLYEIPCNLTLQSFCCQFTQFSFNVTDSWQIQVFQSVLVMFSLFSIIFLVVKLKKTLEYRISVYYTFIVFACITFAVFVLISLLPRPPPSDTLFFNLWTCVYVIIIGLQWFVQMALTIFMFQVDRERNSVQITIFISGFLSIVFVFASIISFLIGNTHPARWIGIIIVEFMMSVGFFTTCLMHFNYCVWCLSRPPRPAVFGWSLFQTIAHSLFTGEYLLHMLASFYSFEQCVVILSNVFYYSLYALMLYKTMQNDINYWRSAGSLLNSFASLDFAKIETSKKKEFKNLLHQGVVFIRWDELKLKRFIGAGFYAEVLEGIWRGTKVAVKRLKIPPNPTEQQELLNDLIKECMILSKLRHPNIVLFLGLCPQAPNLAIITEFMSRGSLWSILHPSNSNQLSSDKTTELSWPRRVSFLKDIARGMNFLHHLTPPIIHRDLKSHNVLVDENWNCKVADFGMSRLKTLTQTMSRVGTPQWTAPEILREESYDEMADVWSFGVVCWELVTLEAPFFGLSPLRVISMVAYQNVKLTIPTTCPQVLRELMTACWNDNPKQRPSFQNIIEWLERIPQEEIAQWPTTSPSLSNVVIIENNTNTNANNTTTY